MKEHIHDLRETFSARKKTIKIALIVLIVFCTAGLVAASFYDLRINQAMNNPAESFSKFMSLFGELPAYAFNLGFFAVLFVWLVRRKKYYWSALPIIIAIGFGYFFSSQRFFGDSASPVLFNLLLNAVCIGALCWLFFSVSPKTLDKFLFILLIACILSAVTNLVMIIFKTLWGRVRFTNLSDAFGNFTPWYQPNGINGHKSFFSGHVTSACILAVLFFVPTVFKIKNRFVTCLMFVFPFVWTLAMMYARITIGAHYLSDTVFAVFNFAVWLIVVMYFLCRERKKDAKSLG